MDVEWKLWEVIGVSVVSSLDGKVRFQACAVLLASRIMCVGFETMGVYVIRTACTEYIWVKVWARAGVTTSVKRYMLSYKSQSREQEPLFGGVEDQAFSVSRGSGGCFP